MLGKPFVLEEVDEKDDGILVSMSFDFDSCCDDFPGFPHEFSLRFGYFFGEDVLKQRVELENCSSSFMPFGVGFHTAFRFPFGKKDAAFSREVKISAGSGCWELSPERRIPTGRLIDWPDGESFNSEDGRCFSNDLPLARHFPLADNGYPFYGALISSPSDNMVLSYEFDKDYKHCALWNDGGGKGFLCIEPMTWMTNAPNLELSPEISGIRSLAPGGRWQAETIFRVSDISEKMDHNTLNY